jgi:uncharacterized protein involved in exopolysaccharide biosynthesis
LSRLLARWPRYVAVGVAAGAIMFGLTFLMPSWYRSRAVLLPPEETDQMASGTTALRLLARMPTIGGSTDYYTPSDIYRAILVSRWVMDAIVSRFDLQRVYHVKDAERAVKELRNHVRVTLGADALITIDVEDRSRTRAADMANAMVTELDRYNVERRNTQARRTRIFLERRITETDSLSKRAEIALRAYQEEHHVVVPVESGANIAGPLADLMARKVALEVQLSVLRSYLREDNERVIQTRTELDELNRRLGQAPQLEGELARLIRDVRLHQQTYLLLTGQLEEARMREAMDTPTVTVLDDAVPVKKRIRPLRAIWALAALALSVVATVVWDERRATRANLSVPPRAA